MGEGLRWLFDEFAIGGVNLENGDFMVCHCPRCRAHRDAWPKDDPDFFRMQALAYVPAVEFLRKRLADKLVTWATYTGFGFGLPQQTPDPKWPAIGAKVPEVLRRIDGDSIVQWTLTDMVKRPSLPLATYLDDGAPGEALDSPWWPRELKPPARRSVGFLHQGSQWVNDPEAGRYALILGTIKEGCLRAYRAGLEGVSIHGEVTDRHVPWALNYLAFSHFIREPEDSLRAFGRRTLGRIFDDDRAGETFIEALASWESGTLSDALKKDVTSRARTLRTSIAAGRRDDLDAAHLWHWLDRMVQGLGDTHAAGFC
jgi:hypothetical protein